MTAYRFLPILLTAFAFLLPAHSSADAPAGESWFTIESPNFRVHHTLPLEPYARSVTQAFERSLPVIEQRMNWRMPRPLDVVVMDPSDSANGLAMSFPNTHIELFSSPFAADSPLGSYTSWTDELAMHELTHIVANDTGLGFYKVLRAVFGSWIKPNGFQPIWLTEGLAVYQETSLSNGGRGRSPLLDAMLRVAVLENKLNAYSYTSLDRFNDSVPWWPGGNTAYLMGYTIQALPTKGTENLPGKVSYENAGNFPFSPNRALRNVNGETWRKVWDSATTKLASRYSQPAGEKVACKLTNTGRHTGGHAVSSDGWIYFTEEDWNNGHHLARLRSDAPCGSDTVERLVRKRYSGPTQVAVAPGGKTVAYSAFDPGFETLFADIYLWSTDGSTQRVTKDARVRDPAFLDDDTLLFIRANADTSQSIVRKVISNEEEESVLFTSAPFERVSGLFSAKGRILFSLHDNKGHEKIHEIAYGKASPLLPQLDANREFEHNPFLAADGSVYFSASYGYGTQEIFRLAPGAKTAERVMASSSGYLDRPVLLSDGVTLLVQDYGLNGLDLARGPVQKLKGPSPQGSDLHEFMTGEKPFEFKTANLDLPASVPYSATGTTGIGLWPQYWFPEVFGTQDGWLAGASTSGNDALAYHKYFAMVQHDSRSNFPTYRAFYRNRSNKTAFHFEALQNNNYFSSIKQSHRNATYSLEAIFPLWDFSIAFGTAYRERHLFGAERKNMLLFNSISIDRTGKTPSAIAPNWGQYFSSFVGLFPSSKSETTFTDVRPQLGLFFRGLLPNHSIGLVASAGISTNRFLASNYYQGGGPSGTTESSFIVRGYPTDALFGTKVVTANLSYTFPLWQVHHGLGTAPIFLDNIGFRLLGDAGTANFMAIYNGKNFSFYEVGDLGRRKIFGAGGDLLIQGSLLYHIPVTVIVGGHYGFQKRHGGGSTFYLALGIGLDRGTGDRPKIEHSLYENKTPVLQNE